jgi:hypothetical protein
MKTLVKLIFVFGMLAMISSCEKDEGKLPNISFKSGGTYISTDASVDKKAAILIGIDASKAEDKDVLKKFNISKSVNGGTPVSIVDKDLSGSEGDVFSFDFNTTNDTVVGQKNNYTFTVTNRDGLSNQVGLTITVK